MPRPRPPPGRIPHSSRTRSRRRARPASSRSGSAVAWGPAPGRPSPRRAGSGGPAAPGRPRSGPGPRRAGGRRSRRFAGQPGLRGGRPLPPGPPARRTAGTASSRRHRRDRTGRRRRGWPASCPTALGRRAGVRRPRPAAPARLHDGSQPARPCSRTGPPGLMPAADRARTDAGRPVEMASIGPATTPAAVSRASRPTVLATAVDALRTDLRWSRSTTGRPARRPPERLRPGPEPTTRGAPAGTPGRHHRAAGQPQGGWQRRRRAPGAPGRNKVATAGSARSSPSRWAATRSGTRSERDRKGRSGSSTSTRPATIRGASARTGSWLRPTTATCPHSSRPRPMVARRRVTSSLR